MEEKEFAKQTTVYVRDVDLQRKIDSYILENKIDRSGPTSFQALVMQLLYAHLMSIEAPGKTSDKSLKYKEFYDQAVTILDQLPDDSGWRERGIALALAGLSNIRERANLETRDQRDTVRKRSTGS